MTNEEAKQAFIKQCPVVHNCRCSGSLITYKRICKYIHEIRGNGKMYIAIALTDEKEHCIVYAEPRDVEEYDESKPLDREHYFVINTRQPC